MRQFSEIEYLQLKQAERLLGDVQVQMAKDGEPDDEWSGLFRIRVELGRELHNRRPDDWNVIEVNRGSHD